MRPNDQLPGSGVDERSQCRLGLHWQTWCSPAARLRLGTAPFFRLGPTESLICMPEMTFETLNRICGSLVDGRPAGATSGFSFDGGGAGGTSSARFLGDPLAWTHLFFCQGP